MESTTSGASKVKKTLSKGPAPENDDVGVTSQLEKQQITLREGNVAYEIERPLFETDACIELAKLKEEFNMKLIDAASVIKELPTSRFLRDMSDEIDQETVILASYPRSGNTLLRAYLEKMMGLVTGSDCDIEKKLNKELLTMGL